MATMQVRSIEDKLYNALKAKAKADNRSISQEVIVILKKYLSQPEQNLNNVTNSFLELAGSWQDKRTAEEIVKDIRKSRATRRVKKEIVDVFD